MCASVSRTIPFTKMHGCGNDFVLIDNRELKIAPEHMPHWAKSICPRGFGVGADGLIFLENTPPGREPADYIWHFFNADGSRAEMCGNASRCAATLAVELGLAGPEHILGTDAGPIKARILPDTGEVKVQLTPPKDLQTNIILNIDENGRKVHFVDTGVPHAIVFSEDVDRDDVKRLGPAVRFHEHFAPAGTNVNFVQVTGNDTMLLRTYERGVEEETHACGTGAAAALVIASHLEKTGPIATITTTGKEILTVSVENDAVFLQGKAVKVYSGELFPAGVGLSIE